MSSPTTAQLILIQGDSGFQQVIDLQNRKVSIGRAQNCDIIWGSLQISRQHATLEYLIPKWYIRDTSTNGLTLNGNKLGKGELVPLSDTDIISFIPTGSVRYRFKYVPAGSPSRALPTSRIQNHPTTISPQPSTSASAVTSPSTREVPPRTENASNAAPGPEVLALISSSSSDSEDSNHSESLLSLDQSDYLNISGDDRPNSRAGDLASEDGSLSPFASKRKHIGGESSDSDSNNMDRKKTRFNQLHLLAEEDDSRSRSFTFRDGDAPTTSSSVNFSKTTPSKNKCKPMTDDQITKCDDLKTLKEQLRACMTKLANTQCNLEALKFERDVEREEQQKKENDAKSVNAAFEEETLKKFFELMESELSCAVCNEIFIQATVVDCGHTFCSFCINEWARKKQECPICRKAFRNRSRHIEVENFINRMIETLTPDMVSRRKNSIKDRDEQAKKANEEARNAANPRRPWEHPNFPAPGFLHHNNGGGRDIFLPADVNFNQMFAHVHIPAPNRNGRGNANAERRRSARIQVRENDGVAGGAPQVRGRHARGRGRMAAVNVAPAHNMQNPPVVPAPAAQQARLDLNLNQNPAPPVPRPEIPVVTLNDSSNEDAPAAGIRFHNPFINYLEFPQLMNLRDF